MSGLGGSGNSIIIQRPGKSGPDDEEKPDPKDPGTPPGTPPKRLRVGKGRINLHPVIRDARLRKLGLRTGSDLSMKLSGYWRVVNVEAQSPTEVFFPCYGEKFNELKTTAISIAEMQDAINALVLDPNWMTKEATLNAINPKLIKFLAAALYGRFSRGILSTAENSSAWDDLTIRQWIDFFGAHEVNEIIDTLQEAMFVQNIDFNIDGNDFNITLSKADGSTVDVVTGTVSDRGTVSFKMNKETPPENVDDALHAMVDLVCSHRQSNNSNVVTLTMGNNVEEVIRLAQLFLCGGHVHLDLSKVIGPVNSRLAAMPDSDYKASLTELWEIIKYFRMAYDAKDSSKLGEFLPTREAGDPYPDVARTKAGMDEFFATVLGDTRYFEAPGPSVGPTSGIDPATTPRPPAYSIDI